MLGARGGSFPEGGISLSIQENIKKKKIYRAYKLLEKYYDLDRLSEFNFLWIFLNDELENIFRDSFRIAESSPTLFKKAIKIVNKPISDKNKPKCTQEQAISYIQQSIFMRFAKVQEDHHSCQDLDIIFKILNKILSDDFVLIMDYIMPCFAWDIQSIYIHEYEKQVYSILLRISQVELDMSEIRTILRWIYYDYNKVLSIVGLSYNSASFPYDQIIETLTGKYEDLVRVQFEDRINGILETDMNEPPLKNQKGEYYSHAPTLIIRMIDTQIKMARKVKSSELLFIIYKASSGAIELYQKKLESYLTDDLYQEYLVAILNNTDILIDNCQDLAQHYLDSDIILGFKHLSTMILDRMVYLIEDSLEFAWPLLFIAEYQDNLLSEIFDEYRKYISELVANMNPLYHEKLRLIALDGFINHYVHELLSSSKNIGTNGLIIHVISRIKSHRPEIMLFWSSLISNGQLEPRVRVLDSFTNILIGFKDEILDAYRCINGFNPKYDIHTLKQLIEYRKDLSKKQKLSIVTDKSIQVD
jgi:hypothetical protein